MVEPRFTDAKQLLDVVQLIGIGCFELFAARGPLQGKERPVVGPGAVEDVKVINESHSLEIFWLPAGGRLLVRLTFELTTDVGDLRVGMQAEWDIGEVVRDNVAIEAEEEFINRVAVMALVPYARSSLNDLSLRTFDKGITMGLLRPGELEFTSQRRVEAESEGEAGIG